MGSRTPEVIRTSRGVKALELVGQLVAYLGAGVRMGGQHVDGPADGRGRGVFAGQNVVDMMSRRALSPNRLSLCLLIFTNRDNRSSLSWTPHRTDPSRRN